VIQIRWTRTAVEQLERIEKSEYRWQVARTMFGLAHFPQRGRIPPEVRRVPEYRLSGELREVVFPGLVRVFYRWDESRETIFILGMSFRGQDVTPEWLVDLAQKT